MDSKNQYQQIQEDVNQNSPYMYTEENACEGRKDEVADMKEDESRRMSKMQIEDLGSNPS